jgi:hypothetical protein
LWEWLVIPLNCLLHVSIISIVASHTLLDDHMIQIKENL